jgi:SAM-dependent methyltransferase
MADLHDRLRGFWDLDAEIYDSLPSHALTDPVEASAWRAVLARHLPAEGASVLDVGAGTGAMSLLAAELGHRVTALDLSPAMLSRLREKAEARGFNLETVIGSASEPPPGPFDAVIERHVLWTTPDPVGSLEAWRKVAPAGRLILFEGLFARDSLSWRARERIAGTVQRLLGIPSGHHQEYEPDLLASLPLARGMSLGPLARSVTQAGWRRIRMERLRDVEWARRMASHWLLSRLQAVPQFALIAEA